MKVISTNIGKKRKVTWGNQEIYTGIYKFQVNNPISLGLTDVENDQVIDRRYHGGLDKSCYLYAANHYEYWKQLFPDLDWQWGMFGENITVEGLDESELYIGDILKIGETEVQITQPRQPCFKLGIRLENSMAVKKFIEAERPGIYVRILKPGKVKSGDTIEIKNKKANSYSVKDVFHFLYHSKTNKENIKTAMKIPELAESCKMDLSKLL